MTSEDRGSPDMAEAVAEIADIVATCRADHTERVTAVEDLTREISLKLQAIQTELKANCQDVRDLKAVMTGDAYHPNGLNRQVKRIDDDLRALRIEWKEVKAGIRGLAIGVGLGAGLVGGGVAAAIAQLVGS